MRINRLRFLVVSHHFAKCSGHKPCGSSETAARIFCVTLEGLVIKGSGDFMDGNSSLFISILLNLIAVDILLNDL